MGLTNEGETMAIGQQAPPIEQERIDGEDSGVEQEKLDGEPTLVEPWDPNKIRVDPKQYSLRQIVDMIRDNELDLAPDFQRQKVWGPLQKSRLIESILLRIPLPAFYFSSDNEGRMQVVDGLQRLSTIDAFMKNEFALADLEYLKTDLDGNRFKDIENTVWGRRMKGTQIIANVIDPQTPVKVKFDIFKRINTLGEPLTAQEIRHSMSHKVSRDFLRECADSQEFLKATGRSLYHHKRMADREAVLRFCAFRMLNRHVISDYAKHESMDVFLTAATDILDKSDDRFRDSLRVDLARAMDNALRLFDRHAFRKWRLDEDDRMNPINKPLLEAWSVVLADFEWQDIEPRAAAIVYQSRVAMTSFWPFVEAISTGTGDPRKVVTRFDVVRQIVKMAGIGPMPWALSLQGVPEIKC